MNNAAETSVGKATTAIHLAAYLQTLAPTLLVDGDVIRASTKWSKRGDGKGLPFMVMQVAQMDELTDENLIVLVKKTETAIPKDQIDRIDARPMGGSRVTKETTTKETPPDSKAAAEAGSAGPAGPTTSTTTSVSFGGKPDFETVYRRPVGAPKE